MGEIRLPRDLYDRLCALARRHGVPLEYVIRVALEHFLAQQERLEART
jgi:predicted DNA-binding protein